MYNVYVTNQSTHNVYIRLRRQTLSLENPKFHSQIEKFTVDKEHDVMQLTSGLNSFLVQMGFCMIPPQKTMSFTIGTANDATRMYASLYALSKLWIMDYEVDYLNFGCLFVKSASVPGSEAVLFLNQANPEPVWTLADSGDPLPANMIKAGSHESDEGFYFGRSNRGIPCRFTTNKNVCHLWEIDSDDWISAGEILQDTGHQLLRALSGDPVPPNAVNVGVSETEGSLFLGRVGGTIPCSISTENGKIKHFIYFKQGEKKVENGEIMVLTNTTIV